MSGLCLLPDGRLASGSYDDTVRLWDVRTCIETDCLEVTGRPFFNLRYPDGRLASGSDDKTIRLWDITNGSKTASLEGHTHGVTALCLVPNGWLASGSNDNTVRLWDVAAGTEVACLELDAPVKALVTLPPQRIVAGDERGVLHWLEVLA